MHVTPAINTPEVNQVEDDAEEQRNTKSNQGEEKGICSVWYKTIWNTPEEGEAAWGVQKSVLWKLHEIDQVVQRNNKQT